MSIGTNTDLQSMLQQALGQIKSLDAGQSNIKSIAGYSGTDLSRSLWTIAGEAEQAINGNNEDRARASISILQGILNMISFGNHQAEAQREVKQNSDNINKNENQENKKAVELQQQIEGFAASIAANSSNIENALDKLDALGNDNNDLESIKEQILEQLKVIEENQQKLNNPETREEALEAISNAALTIDSLVELMGQTILNIQKNIEEQNSIIEQNLNEVTQTLVKSTENISQGVADIQKYIQKDAQEGTRATQISEKGATNIATGEAEVAAGEAANSNVFSAFVSGGQGVKLIIDGNKRISGGNTGVSGGIQNLRSVMTGIGKMGQDISSLSELTNSLGKIGDGVLDLAGQYQDKIQPYIASIGTYDIKAICAANENLQTQVKTWKDGQNIEQNDKQNVVSNNNDSKNDSVKQFKAAFGI